ncbi:MAG: AraC family transcriptional regulator [Bacteroides fragilis]
MGTDECTLKRGFKTVFGTTVFGHIFEYRMTMACRYLLDSSKTIQEIGACVGYEYSANFVYCFQTKGRTYSFGIQMVADCSVLE